MITAGEAGCLASCYSAQSFQTSSGFCYFVSSSYSYTKKQNIFADKKIVTQ